MICFFFIGIVKYDEFFFFLDEKLNKRSEWDRVNKEEEEENRIGTQYDIKTKEDSNKKTTRLYLRISVDNLRH